MGQGRLHNPDSRHPSAHWFCSSFCTHSPWGPSLEETFWTLNLLDPVLPWLPRSPCVVLGRDLVTQHWPISLPAPAQSLEATDPQGRFVGVLPYKNPTQGLAQSGCQPSKWMKKWMNEQVCLFLCKIFRMRTWLPNPTAESYSEIFEKVYRMHLS